MATGERILLVESDPDIVDLIVRQSLQPLGYRVGTAGDAASAIKLSIQTPPDLILANLNLPGLSGKDMLAALSAQGVKSPVIVIAEKGQETDAIQAFRLGASDVIFWPVRDAEVVSIVERALRQTQQARERQKLDRQLSAMNTELQRRLRDLTTLLSTAKAVISITDQRLLFDRILESAMQVAEADYCWLTLREEKGNAYLLRAHRNLPEAWAKKLNQPLDDGISSLVGFSGESLVMNGSPLQKFKIATLGKSVGVIPIKIQGEVIGLLMVARKVDREIARDSQTMLEAMADFASISLVNARLFRALEHSAETARTNEKQRHAALEQVRSNIRNEIQAAGYPLNLVLTESPGPLNPEQKKALEQVQVALQRLVSSSEKTTIPNR
ncbi:MAG: response regulator [Anaerolineales bacterium]|uniref:response regulator n=1 Tax=Candidatus Villigracilis affinis TaxID=3140682 RepID=UPI001DB6492C|nr:response regulator [Anaerolineales bacterium]MBK9600478.1 response regulator [Anaerolineales bacterium]